MNGADLRQKSAAELRDLIFDLRKEHFNLRMQKGSGQLAKPSQMKVVRREIARIKTILNEQQSKK